MHLLDNRDFPIGLINEMNVQNHPHLPHRNPLPWILLGVGIFLLAILCLGGILLLTLRSSVFKTATETAAPALIIQATQIVTPSPTVTSSVTPSPTTTYTPTITPTQPPFPTSTAPATLTPATPEKKNEYMLPRLWTRTEIPGILSILENDPGIPPAAQSADLSTYYQSFYPAALAYGEAVQQTGSGNTISSELGLALNLARIGDPEASQAYALAVSKALNQGLTDLPALCDWLYQRQAMLTFRCHPLAAFNAAYARMLVEITGVGSGLILIEQMPGGYHGVPLASLFNFAVPQESRLLMGDLTGDGQAEAILWQIPPAGISPLVLPLVFDLTQIPVKQLPFLSDEQIDINLEYEEEWTLVTHTGENPRLDLNVRALPACPIDIHRQYGWDGIWLSRLTNDYQVQASKDLLGYCSLLVDHALEVWEPAAVVQVIEQILPSWPPANAGNDPPPMSKQELLTHLGIAYALQADFSKAVQYLKQAAALQTPNDDFWMGEANRFLALYHKQEDLYRACLSVKTCDLRFALIGLSSSLNPENDDQSLLLRLACLGVVVRASGLFDFDGDTLPELWFTLAPRPGSYLEFWILTRNKDGIQILFVDTLNTNLPKPVILDKSEAPPAVQIDEQTTLHLHPAQNGAKAYLETYQGDYFWDVYVPHRLQKDAEKAIFGAASSDILADLKDLKKQPQFNCVIARPECVKYYTLLGLACQRNNDVKCALENYLNVWRKYPASPYTTYVRLRLSRAPQAPAFTPTLPPTLTPYGGKSPTPRRILPTPTLTRTPTPHPSALPGPVD